MFSNQGLPSPPSPHRDAMGGMRPGLTAPSDASGHLAGGGEGDTAMQSSGVARLPLAPSSPTCLFCASIRSWNSPSVRSRSASACRPLAFFSGARSATMASCERVRMSRAARTDCQGERWDGGLGCTGRRGGHRLPSTGVAGSWLLRLLVLSPAQSQPSPACPSPPCQPPPRRPGPHRGPGPTLDTGASDLDPGMRS